MRVKCDSTRMGEPQSIICTTRGVYIETGEYFCGRDEGQFEQKVSNVHKQMWIPPSINSQCNGNCMFGSEACYIPWNRIAHSFVYLLNLGFSLPNVILSLCRCRNTDDLPYSALILRPHKNRSHLVNDTGNPQVKPVPIPVPVCVETERKGRAFLSMNPRKWVRFRGVVILVVVSYTRKRKKKRAHLCTPAPFCFPVPPWWRVDKRWWWWWMEPSKMSIRSRFRWLWSWGVVSYRGT